MVLLLQSLSDPRAIHQDLAKARTNRARHLQRHIDTMNQLNHRDRITVPLNTSRIKALLSKDQIRVLLSEDQIRVLLKEDLIAVLHNQGHQDHQDHHVRLVQGLTTALPRKQGPTVVLQDKNLIGAHLNL